jgi:hypothetical protein
MLKLDQQYILAIKRQWEGVWSAIKSSFSSAIMGMIEGTMTWQKAMASVLKALLGAFINLGVEMLFTWIKMLARKVIMWVTSETVMTAASSAGALARMAAETSATGATVAIKAISSTKEITGSAAAGAAAAYKAMAGIPVIGPILGAIAAALVFAAIMAFKSMVPSAEGGWDIPRDSLAMVHGGEMVLPSELADRIRGMSEPTGKGPTVVNFNVQAWDSADIKRFFKLHGNSIVEALHDPYRNFKTSRFGRYP